MKTVYPKGMGLDMYNIITRVYDVDKKELISEFPSYRLAAKYLGVDEKKVRNAAIKKTRIQSDKLGKLVCIRTGKAA